MVAPLAAVSRLPVVVWVHNYEVPRAFRIIRPFRSGLTVAGHGWRSRSTRAACSRRRGPSTWSPIRSSFPPDPLSEVRQPPLRVVYLAGTDHPVKGFDLLPEIIRSVPATEADFVVVASRVAPFAPPAVGRCMGRAAGAPRRQGDDPFVRRRCRRDLRSGRCGAHPLAAGVVQSRARRSIGARRSCRRVGHRCPSRTLRRRGRRLPVPHRRRRRRSSVAEGADRRCRRTEAMWWSGPASGRPASTRQESRAACAPSGLDRPGLRVCRPGDAGSTRDRILPMQFRDRPPQQRRSQRARARCDDRTCS